MERTGCDTLMTSMLVWTLFTQIRPVSAMCMARRNAGFRGVALWSSSATSSMYARVQREPDWTICGVLCAPSSLLGRSWSHVVTQTDWLHTCLADKTHGGKTLGIHRTHSVSGMSACIFCVAWRGVAWQQQARLALGRPMVEQAPSSSSGSRTPAGWTDVPQEASCEPVNAQTGFHPHPPT